MSSQNPDTVSYSEGTDLATPITVAFDGRTRKRFETVVDDEPARRTAARTKTRLKVQTTGEAEALLSALAGMDLLSFDPQMIPTLHRVRDELVDGLETRGYAVADGHVHEQELVADGGVPQSFEDLAGTCESCGEDVDPERLIEGECPGCQYRPDVATDGGLHTVEHDGTDYVVCHMVAYENSNDPEIELEDGDPVVTNHDEIPKYDEVRLLTLESVEENDLHHMAISPSSSLWEDEFEDLEPGDAVRVSQETFTDGGGVTWTDLHAFQRDCLEVISRLENKGETTYGLAILSELENEYGREITHGRVYPNLDELVDAGLVEKGELDNRTNSYDLTAEGKSMLEQRARLLAEACGMEQPVADGGDSA